MNKTTNKYSPKVRERAVRMEGDMIRPWIRETRSKEATFGFLGVFSSNLRTTLWKNTDAFASGAQQQ